eukprot:2352477-Amphidinium_carterae.1
MSYSRLRNSGGNFRRAAGHSSTSVRLGRYGSLCSAFGSSGSSRSTHCSFLEDAYTSQSVRLARVRQRGVVGSTKCRAIFVQLPLEVVATFSNPVATRKRRCCSRLDSRSKNQFPHHGDIAVLADNTPSEGEGSGGRVSHAALSTARPVVPALVVEEGQSGGRVSHAAVSTVFGQAKHGSAVRGGDCSFLVRTRRAISSLSLGAVCASLRLYVLALATIAHTCESRAAIKCLSDSISRLASSLH